MDGHKLQFLANLLFDTKLSPHSSENHFFASGLANYHSIDALHLPVSLRVSRSETLYITYSNTRYVYTDHRNEKAENLVNEIVS